MKERAGKKLSALLQCYPGGTLLSRSVKENEMILGLDLQSEKKWNSKS